MGYRQARWDEPLILEMGLRGRRGYLPPRLEPGVAEEVGPLEVPVEVRRRDLPRLPEVSEVEVVRHYVRLSQMNYGVDSGPLPLGSCTMKYNPKLPLRYLGDPSFAMLHPYQDEETVQGILQVLYEMQEWLKHVTGMDVCTLHPSAGAQGELAGVLTIRAYHDVKGNEGKDEMIVPDSAHGTNPASAAMAGFKVVEVPTAPDGNVDMEALKAAVSGATAGLMITNPSTLGLFEERILEIADLVHSVDGLLYYDGANLNGIMGYARPGDMGFDIAHLNVHKTFGAPHGGGGPGAGPVCVRDRPVKGGLRLSSLLPGPVVVRESGRFRVKWPEPPAPGALRGTIANTGVVLWGYVYMLLAGARGLREATEQAVLNTNYFLHLMRGVKGYSLHYGEGRWRKHEAVLSAQPLKEKTGVTAKDVAKALLDRGFYAPTIYFPLIVPEALMIEFTESETLENIEAYARALREIAEEARRDPARILSAPRNTSVARVDEVKANHPRSVTPTWRVHRLRREGKLGPLR
ncbi:aminomethyl-transferring glycine dehydrogenase subunit GcvPB [Stetteria hydrogenophila]